MPTWSVGFTCVESNIFPSPSRNVQSKFADPFYWYTQLESGWELRGVKVCSKTIFFRFSNANKNVVKSTPEDNTKNNSKL